MTEDAKADATSAEPQDVYVPIPSFDSWLDIQVGDSTLYTVQSAYSNLRDETAPDTVETLVNILERQAAAESVAIEGFYDLKPGESLSIARERDNWKEILAEQTENGIELFESQLNAFKYAREHVAQGLPVTQQTIKEIHIIACREQPTYEVLVSVNGAQNRSTRPLQHGSYKTEDNVTVLRSGRIHSYSPVYDTEFEMQKFVKQMTRTEFAEADALTKAAYAHYCLTHIHPFSDGNGRVARALASAYTSLTFGVPLLVYADRRKAYQQAIEITASGDYRAFVEHILVRVMDALQYARLQLRSLARPNIAERFGNLIERAEKHRELILKDSEAVAIEIVQAMQAKATAKMKEILNLNSGYLVSMNDDSQAYRPHSTTRAGFRMSTGFAIGLKIVKPENVPPCTVHLSAGYADDLSQDFAFFVGSSTSKDFDPYFPSIESFQIVREDVNEGLSATLLDRLDSLVDATIEYILNTLESEFEKVLKQTGNLGI